MSSFARKRPSSELNTTMAPTLEDLPNELFEYVVQQLNLSDICNLRCGSRQLSSKSTQTHFKSFFQRKHVDLNEHALNKFAQATRTSKLCRRMKHLALVGVVDAAPFFEDKTSAEMREEINETQHGQPPQGSPETTHNSRHALCSPSKSKTNIGLLSKALRNLSLRDNNTTRRLPCLSLETRLENFDTQRPVRLLWDLDNRHRLELEHDDVAARVFHFTMESLAISGLKIGKLEIYPSNMKKLGFPPSNEIEQFGLYSTELTDVQTHYPGLEACFASTTSLSISLCSPRPSGSCPGDQSPVRASPSSQEVATTLNVQTGEHSPGLAHLLQLTNNLENLDLQYCGLPRCPRDMPRNRRHPHALFASAAASNTLPRLRLCRIRGLHCHPDDLSLFLQRVAPRHIVLHTIYLDPGSWQRILEHITDPHAGVESLRLSNLMEEQGDGSLWFSEAPTRPEFAFAGDIGDCTLARRGDAVGRPLEYYVMSLVGYGDLMMRANNIEARARA